MRASLLSLYFEGPAIGGDVSSKRDGLYKIWQSTR